MTYLLMIGITFGVFSQNICAKQFYKRNQDNSKAIFVYCFIMTLGAFFVATIAMAVQASWNPGTLLYAGIFAICYLCAIIFIALAIQSGPLSLSSLLQSLSLIIPTVYGLIVLQEKLSMLGWIGIICLLISVITTNIYKKGNKPTKCWFVFILLACFGNGLCSVVQKAHQIAYGDMFSTLFMSFAKPVENRSYMLLADGRLFRVAQIEIDYQSASKQALRLFGTPLGTTLVLRLVEEENKWGVR